MSSPLLKTSGDGSVLNAITKMGEHVVKWTWIERHIFLTALPTLHRYRLHWFNHQTFINTIQINVG